MRHGRCHHYAGFIRLGGVELPRRRGKGSHRVVRMLNGKNLTVPAGVLKVGLLMHLIQVAGITPEEFEARL